jgi:hypothetical protein
MPKWNYENIREHSPFLRQCLDEGWEPFAVTNELYFDNASGEIRKCNVIHVRKRTD